MKPSARVGDFMANSWDWQAASFIGNLPAKPKHFALVAPVFESVEHGWSRPRRLGISQRVPAPSTDLSDDALSFDHSTVGGLGASTEEPTEGVRPRVEHSEGFEGTVWKVDERR